MLENRAVSVLSIVMDDGRIPYGTGDLFPTLDEGEGESTITYSHEVY